MRARMHAHVRTHTPTHTHTHEHEHGVGRGVAGRGGRGETRRARRSEVGPWNRATRGRARRSGARKPGAALRFACVHVNLMGCFETCPNISPLSGTDRGEIWYTFTFQRKQSRGKAGCPIRCPGSLRNVGTRPRALPHPPCRILTRCSPAESSGKAPCHPSGRWTIKSNTSRRGTHV